MKVDVFHRNDKWWFIPWDKRDWGARSGIPQELGLSNPEISGAQLRRKLLSLGVFWTSLNIVRPSEAQHDQSTGKRREDSEGDSRDTPWG